MFLNLGGGKKTYLLLDIGGTNTKIGVSEDLKTIKESKIIPTNFNYEEALKEIKRVAEELSGGVKISAVASSVKSLNKTKDSILVHPFVHLWEEKPLKASLEEIFCCPVILEGDGATVALGEAVFGAGKGKRIVAFLTISTGFGGAKIVDGKIDPNSMGFEPGHQIIDFKTGMAIEGYLSGIGFKNRFKKEAHEVTDPKVWDGAAKVLAIGINNTLVYWSPEIVILGGSMMQSISLDKVKQYTKETVKIFPKIPEIINASLGDEGGLYGTIALLLEKNL